MSVNEKIIIFLIALWLVALFSTLRWLRSRSLLNKWAKANGFKLVKMNLNLFSMSPITLSSSRQEVYRIKVRDHIGRERNGWAICGGIWLGLLANEVAVKWDKRDE